MAARIVNSSAASSAPTRTRQANTRITSPSSGWAAGVFTSPRFQASQSAAGARSRPWPASGSVHQSRARSAAGRANTAANASAVRISGSRAATLSRLSSATWVFVRAALVMSARPTAKEHHRDRLQHDLEVFPGRGPVDVLEVVGDLLAHVLQRGVVLQVDLGVSGDP